MHQSHTCKARTNTQGQLKYYALTSRAGTHCAISATLCPTLHLPSSTVMALCDEAIVLQYVYVGYVERRQPTDAFKFNKSYRAVRFQRRYGLVGFPTFV